MSSATRLVNNNERITDDMLNDAQDAGIATGVSAQGLYTRMVGSDLDGLVLQGLTCKALSASQVQVATGSAIVVGASAGGFDPVSYIEATATENISVTAEAAGDVRIDLVTASLDTSDDTSVSVYVRDPVSGSVSASSLTTRRVHTVEVTLVAGTPVTASGWSPGAGTGAHTDVIQGPAIPANAIPLAWVYVDSSGVQAVLDARPMPVPGQDTSVRPSVLFGSDDPAGALRSDPSQWQLYGTDAGTGVSNTLRVGCLNTNGLPTAPLRFVDGRGISQSVPPGTEATMATTTATTEFSVTSASNAVSAALAATTSNAAAALGEASFDGAGAISTRMIGEGYSLSRRGVLDPEEERSIRVYPRIEVQDHSAASVTVRVNSVMADGEDVPLYIRANSGITWKLTLYYKDTGAVYSGNNEPYLAADGNHAMSISGTHHNVTSVIGSNSTSGTMYVVQDTSDDDSAYFEFEVIKSGGTVTTLYIEVEPMLMHQANASDSRYDAELDPANNGFLRYVPGGSGIAHITTA